MAINLEFYRKNKDIIKDLKKVNSLFVENFPDKTTGWVSVTALIYSQLTIEDYLEKSKEVNPKLIPSIKAVLWDYINELGSLGSGKDKQE